MRTYPHTIHKINSKWLKDLNIRYGILRFLEDIIGKTFSDINCTTVFLSQYPKEIEIKAKINKWKQIKPTGFLHSRGNQAKRKDNLRNGRKYLQTMWPTWLNFQNIQIAHTTQQQNKQTTQSKVGKRPRQTSLQRRHRFNRHKKRCSTLLIIREMQIKTTMKYHLILVRMAIIKNSTNNKCWRGCGEKRTLLYCWRECKLMQSLKNSMEVSKKN